MRKLLLVSMLCGLAGCAAFSRAEDKEKEEGKEQKVAFSSVPQPVQATLTKEAGGNKIDQVDKETDDGKTIYEADVKLSGHNYEIKVAPDGTLISKKLDEGDESHEKGKSGAGEKEENEKNETK